MAGSDEPGVFKERISPFLRAKMEALRREHGELSPEYRALQLQYVRLDVEDREAEEANDRHWEADLEVQTQGSSLRGMERLYRSSIVIEPTMACAAHCRYCLRANYEMLTLSEDELKAIARYCGSQRVRDELSEVLVTGGDPLVVPTRLRFLVETLVEHAPNIRVIRIGSRLPQQDPERIDENVYGIFRRYRNEVRFELALQLNHPVELFPEAVEKLKRVQDLNVRLYAQNVLLKGVNDDLSVLAELYATLRQIGIEAHYLFHCVPIRRTHHLRTSVQRGLRLAAALTNGGQISGRAKPMFALMTDIGKVTLYDGLILGRRDHKLLLQSSYRLEERISWNPGWVVPPTCEVDKDGYMRVWYLDGSDE